MPSWLQALTYVIPLRYILDVIRGIILKGVGMPVLYPQVVALAVFGTGVMLLAASRFQKRLV
jgi:ABC-2 type transport system permease protein